MNTTIRSSRRIAACLTLLSLCGAEIAFAQCDPVRVMPLGDSITAGFSSGLGDTSLLVGYRKMLYDDLIGSMRWVDFVGGESFGWHVASFDADNEGHGGFTNEDVSLRVYQWLSSNPADYVLLHVGTNYQTVSRDIANLDIILDEIDRYETDTGSSVTVVVAQIIPNGEYSSETEYNQQVASLVTQRIGAGDRLVLVDMESALIFPDDFSDNLHPNASGYAKMAEVWRPVLESLIAPCPVPDSTPPDQPDGLQATPAGSDGVSLRWNASNDVGSTGWVGYRLYRDGVQIATTSHLDYSDSGLSPGMSYIYTLEAYDSVGNISAMSSPASVTTIGTDPTALRINAGGGDYTDTLGRLWQADFGFDTGHAALFSSSQVAGTAEDLLYRSVRWDDGTVPELGYRLALAPGVYQVSLHFMEGFVSGPGQRVFGVDLEGVRTWSGLDVYAEAGGRDVALVKTATVTVQDGQLDIGFVHGVENPMVSAIEAIRIGDVAPDTLAPAPPSGLTGTASGATQVALSWTAATDDGGSGLAGYRVYRDGVLVGTTPEVSYTDTGLTAATTYSYAVEAIDGAGNVSGLSAPVSVTTLATEPLALRINAGGGDYTDTLGRLWQADFGFDTGHAALFSSSQVAGTAEDLLYRSVRWDDGTVPELGYRLALAPGVYQVSLHFMEGFVSGPGQRVFGVDLEGVRTWSGLDVYAEAGGRDVALVKTATVTVQDGQLDIGFVHGVENPMVSAIEVVEVPGP